MNQFVYWPYDEVSLSSRENGRIIAVSSPWLEATFPVTEASEERITLLLQKFSRQDLSAEDLGLVNWFFAHFDRYPLCYILPSPKGEEALDQGALADKDLLQASLSSLFATSLQAAYSAGSDIGLHDVPAIVASLSRQSWEWDTEAALAFAKIGDKVHPESVFTVARRFHFLDVLETNKGRKNFNFIEGLSGDAFATAAGLMVRQNHYVTQKCHGALAPAQELAGQAKPLVQAFMKEENGHDLILNMAMKSFAEDPESVPVSLQTRALMHLLKFAAQRNFLAFAMAVDFFERSSYEDTDPLAQLLVKGGFEKAAKYINRHMDINDAGGHENVACGFLRFVGPCDADYALEALRIAEAITLVINSVPESAVALYEQVRAASSCES